MKIKLSALDVSKHKSKKKCKRHVHYRNASSTLNSSNHPSKKGRAYKETHK